MKRIPLLLLIFGAWCGPGIAGASTNQPSSFTVQYEWFTWREEDQRGRRLLEETGPRVGIRWQSERTDAPIPWAVRAGVYLGTVDYDGKTQLGLPIDSTSDYHGLRAESDATVLSFGETVRGQLFGGLGAHTWVRSLDNTRGFTDTGYNEWWSSIYAQAGLRLDGPAFGGAWSFRGGLRLPLWNRVEYDLLLPDGSSDASVEPEIAPGWFAEADFARGGYTAGLFAEFAQYDRSDAVTRGQVDVFQPESRERIIGLRAGLEF